MVATMERPKTDNMSVFGNEVEIDDVLYVSVDFLRHYPEYLDNEIEQLGEADYETGEPEAAVDETFSTHKSELKINGTTYIALPVVRNNPNYVELKYNQNADVALDSFIPNKYLDADSPIVAMSRRRSISPN